MVRYLVRNASYNRMLTWKYRSTELASLLPVYFKNEAKDQKRKYLFFRKDQAVKKRQRLKKKTLNTIFPYRFVASALLLPCVMSSYSGLWSNWGLWISNFVMVAAKTTNVSHIGTDTSSEWRSKGRLPLRLSELQVERHLSRAGDSNRRAHFRVNTLV